MIRNGEFEQPVRICKLMETSGDHSMGNETLSKERRDWLGYPSEEDGEDEIDGRWIDAVAEYASSCDGCCELTSHEEMEMDNDTQLGFCKECMRDGIEKKALGRKLVPYNED